MNGVEFIRPNAAWASTRASSSANSGRSRISVCTQISTYRRCKRRIARRGSSGRRSSSCRCSAIAAGFSSANATWKSSSESRSAPGSPGVLVGERHAAGQQALADRNERGDHHRLLAGEVVVERRSGDAGGGADVVHRHTVISAGRDEPDRDFQDLIAAAALRMAAGLDPLVGGIHTARVATWPVASPDRKSILPRAERRPGRRRGRDQAPSW